MEKDDERLKPILEKANYYFHKAQPEFKSVETDLRHQTLQGADGKCIYTPKEQLPAMANTFEYLADPA